MTQVLRLATLLAVLLLGSDARAQALVMTQATQLALTPTQSLDKLMAGNARYVSGTRQPRDLAAQRAATASGQFPYASLVACVDSRVPPEIVFDQGIGDVFVARVAGNFVDEEILGSLEFTAKVAGAKVILVLGHSECGAVKGACDGVELGNLTSTLAQIKPAVDAVSGFAPRDSTNAAFVEAVGRKNVELTVAKIRSASPVLRALEEAGELRIAGGIYDLESGRVELLP